MDISQIANVVAGFLLGLLTKWLHGAHKRDKLRRERKNGKTK